MAHKICPKCQSPAPLEATFCGQCGRQYRTHFVTTPQQDSDPALITPFPVRNAEQPASNAPFVKPVTSVAIVLMAALVAVLILLIAHRGPAGGYSGQTVRSTGRPIAAQQPQNSQSAADLVRHGDDPIEEEAKRVVERENARLQTEPPASAVGPDGRIHLRGGGSITREQWDDANRRLRNSPAFRDPMPPPPVN